MALDDQTNGFQLALNEGNISLRQPPQTPSNNAPAENSTHAVSPGQDPGDMSSRRRWLSVAGCAVLTWWFVGITYSWGILQEALVRQGLSSSATLAFVGSLTVACVALFAIISARIVVLLGLRKTGLVGVSLLGVGELCSGFVTHSVLGMFLTTGLVMGMGTSLCFMLISTAPAQYFGRKRGLANGIVFGAGGLGGAVISLSFNALIGRLGISWALWIIGALTLVTGLPAAWIVQQQRDPVRKVAMIEWKLFRDRGFILLFVGCALATFPLFVPPFFLPLYAHGIGLSSSTGAALVAMFNVSSAVGRVLCGVLCDAMGPLNTLSLTLTVSALSMLVVWPVSTSIGPLVLFSIINGAANGGFFSCIPTIAGSTFSSVRISTVMGMIVTGWVGGYLMGAPIAGYLLTAFGGRESGLQAFRPAMYYASSMTLGALAMVALVRLRISSGLLMKL